jgi:hypothetical protein
MNLLKAVRAAKHLAARAAFVHNEVDLGTPHMLH